MNNETKQNSRRKFLLNAGLGGAGVAAVAVAALQAATAAQGGEPAARKRGYHVSEHILKYYKTTQV